MQRTLTEATPLEEDAVSSMQGLGVVLQSPAVCPRRETGVFDMIKRRVPFAGLMMAPLMLALAGCMPGTPTGKMDVTPASFSQLSGWEKEDHTALMSMMKLECQRIAHLPEGTSLGGALTLPYGRQVKDWQGVCTAASTIQGSDEVQSRRFFENWFQPYLVEKQAFYTGYYDPEVPASLTKGGEYQTPVYGRPKDLLRGSNNKGELEYGHWVNSVFRPYDDRATIDKGSLKGKGLEVAWLKSPVDLLFLQTQGSGRLRLPDGQQVFLGYDGRNGQPYVPIGRVLVQRKLMRAEDVNVQSIREWLAAHPDQVKSVLEANPSYVFFRRVDRTADEGPTGGFGLPLTPQRSLAVDRRFVGYAMPVWVDISGQDAQGRYVSWSRMAFAQDTGSDIRGAGRGDLFLGWGDKAAKIAGDMKNYGRMMVLVPLPISKDTGAVQPIGAAGAVSAGGAQAAR